MSRWASELDRGPSDNDSDENGDGTSPFRTSSSKKKRRNSSSFARLYGTAMINPPPLRININLPQTRPMAVITGSGGPAAQVTPRYRPQNSECVAQPRIGSCPHAIIRGGKGVVTDDNAVCSSVPNSAKGNQQKTNGGERGAAPQRNAAVGRTSTALTTTVAQGGGQIGAPLAVIPPTLPTFCTNNLKGGRRGWIQPNFTNLKSTEKCPFRLFSISVLQNIFIFSSMQDLSEAIVYVNRMWKYAVTSDNILTARRFRFEYSGVDYDGNGILHYLARVTAKARRLKRKESEAAAEMTSDGENVAKYATAPRRGPFSSKVESKVQLCASKDDGENDKEKKNMFPLLCPVKELNPSLGPSPLIHVVCSKLIPDTELGTLHVSGVVEAKLKNVQGDGNSDSFREPLSNFTSFGVTHFSTENLPFSWIGIDLGPFSVEVTHYTLGTSVKPRAPFPLEWELQATNDVFPPKIRRDGGNIAKKPLASGKRQQQQQGKGGLSFIGSRRGGRWNVQTTLLQEVEKSTHRNYGVQVFSTHEKYGGSHSSHQQGSTTTGSRGEKETHFSANRCNADGTSSVSHGLYGGDEGSQSLARSGSSNKKGGGGSGPGGTSQGFEDWGNLTWHVLDRRKPGSGPDAYSRTVNSHTFEVPNANPSTLNPVIPLVDQEVEKSVSRTAPGSSESTAVQNQNNTNTSKKGGPASAALAKKEDTQSTTATPHHYRRFRIVQTGRNSQWGNELVASGFELYGRLFLRAGEKEKVISLEK